MGSHLTSRAGSAGTDPSNLRSPCQTTSTASKGSVILPIPCEVGDRNSSSRDLRNNPSRAGALYSWTQPQVCIFFLFAHSHTPSLYQNVGMTEHAKTQAYTRHKIIRTFLVRIHTSHAALHASRRSDSLHPKTGERISGGQFDFDTSASHSSVFSLPILYLCHFLIQLSQAKTVDVQKATSLTKYGQSSPSSGIRSSTPFREECRIPANSCCTNSGPSRMVCSYHIILVHS